MTGLTGHSMGPGAEPAAVALASLKTGLRVPLDSAAPAA